MARPRDSEPGPTRPRHLGRWLIATLLGASLAATLGSWQLWRAQQKLQGQRAQESRVHEPPLAASRWEDASHDMPDLWFRRTSVAGRWRPEFTVYLQNRVWVDDQGQAHAGFYVVTPLEFASGRAVLVQRGWAPRDPLHMNHLPNLPLPQGTQSVSGRLAPWPSRLLSWDHDERGTIRQNIDQASLHAQSGLQLLPLTLQQTESAGLDDGLVRQWPRPAADVAKHYGYAFQWFAMGGLIVAFFVWFQFISPRRQLHATS